MAGGEKDTTDWKGLQTGIAKAAGDQLSNNRLNTSNPFSSQTFNPDGSTSTQFNGGLGGAAAGLANQAGQLGTPMDWNQFGTVGTGDQARNQAIDAGFNAFSSRADPMFARRESALETKLMNQGLDPSSEAYKNAMGDFGNQKTDAYNQAMFSAIGQGTLAGDSVFKNNLMSQQNQIANALRQRGQPIAEMQQMQGLLGQPGYSADNSTLAGQMGVTGIAQNASEQARREAQERADREAQIAGTGASAAGGLLAAGMIGASFF